MIFSYHEVNKLPIAVIDNLYNKSSADKIMQELMFLNNDPAKLKHPQDTGSAWVADQSFPDGKKYLKNNTAISLDSIYADRSISNILSENRKLFSNEIIQELTSYHILFRYLKSINRDATLVSYYENGDFYLPHVDDCTLTAITWFYKSPKAFIGGDLVIENQLTIDCFSNRCVIFPSILMHSVNEIQIDQNYAGNNCGRFAISQFMSYFI